MCRTRPMMRPSEMATPTVPGSHSRKVRRQVMLVAFICSACSHKGDRGKRPWMVPGARGKVRIRSRRSLCPDILSLADYG